MDRKHPSFPRRRESSASRGSNYRSFPRRRESSALGGLEGAGFPPSRERRIDVATELAVIRRSRAVGNPVSRRIANTRHSREGGNPVPREVATTRHSREGGNPVSREVATTGHSREGRNLRPWAGSKALGSRLRGNDESAMRPNSPSSVVPAHAGIRQFRAGAVAPCFIAAGRPVLAGRAMASDTCGRSGAVGSSRLRGRTQRPRCPGASRGFRTTAAGEAPAGR
jgi:hypothetical protein